MISYKMLGNIYLSLTSYDSALFYYQKALDIVENMKKQNPEQRSDLLISIGIAFEERGDYEKALQTYRQNLEKISKFTYDWVKNSHFFTHENIWEML